MDSFVILQQKSRQKLHNNGFSILEVVVSITIFSFIFLVLVSFFLSINASNSKTKADREAGENARRALDQITYEIRSAKSVYTLTTTSSQLSLETTHYLPQDEDDTFIDFFLCGASLCFKKESQNPIALTADTVQVTSLVFTRIVNGTVPSIKIDITVSAINPSNDINHSGSISLSSTVSLRSY